MEAGSGSSQAAVTLPGRCEDGFQEWGAWEQALVSTSSRQNICDDPTREDPNRDVESVFQS